MDQAPAPMTPVVDQLRRVRSRARGLLLAGAAATLLAALLAGLLGAGILDYLLRLPAWLRAVFWVAGIAALVYGFWRLVRPALGFRPSLTEVALRLEHSEEGRKAGISGLLASGLELAEHPETTPVGGWMAENVVREARERFAGVRASSILSLRRTRDSYIAAGVCLAAAAMVVILAGPMLAGIGLARVAAPWSGAQWPKRTALVDGTEVEVHPLGSALPLRATITKTDRPEGETRVTARYRIITAEGAGAPQRVLLTGQGKGDDGRETYERLIEPGTLAAGAESATLEYWFETSDDRTESRRVTLVRPPAVVGAEATISMPAYARSTGSAFVSGPHDLGTGADQRAIVGPVLAGSDLTLKLRLNKPLPPPPAADRTAWAQANLPGLPEAAAIAVTGEVWEFSWRATESLRLPFRIADRHGIRGTEETVFSFDIIEDKPPSATVVEPREDESVLATARVAISGEGRDDVGIRSVEILVQAAKPSEGSMGAAPEPVGEPAMVAASAFGEGGEPVRSQASAGLTLALGELRDMDLAPGDEVWIYASARDNYELDGARHDPVRSSPRKLRIIGEDDLLRQIQSELASVRKVTMRLDEEQADLAGAVAQGSVSDDESRRQQALSQRIGQQRESVQRLRSRIERNQMEDEGLEGLLEDIDSLLEEAAQEAERAGSQMEAAARQAAGETERAPLAPEQQEAIQERQEDVRDKLGQIAEALDRGEDSWVLSRTLQRLAEQQRELQARTQRAGERTMGKRAEDLTPAEQSELQEIADQQQRLSDAAQRAIEELEERAQQMAKVDPAQSEGMKAAAQRGREQQVPQEMQQASQNVQQNQTSTASAQQQEAAENLEQMLQDMNEAQKNRDAALKRILADLLESIEKLITDQDIQIAALERAEEIDDFSGLDIPLIALNANTLDVAARAKADRATAEIGDLVDRAARNQDTAVAALRADPPDPGRVGQAERESLRLLRLAKDEARKLQEQAAKRENDRKRAELRKAYREALEEQVAIQGQTDPLIGKNPDRRERLQVRALGERQESLRQSLETVRRETGEIDSAGTFKYAHERLDAAAAIAGKKLRAGQADSAVARNQAAAVRILQSLVEALSEEDPEGDEFREEASSGGGGGGAGGQEQPIIPPIAELKLLRAMQQEAMDQTRALDEAKADATPEELAGLGEFQRTLHDRAEELAEKLQPPSEAPALPESPGGPVKEED